MRSPVLALVVLAALWAASSFAQTQPPPASGGAAAGTALPNVIRFTGHLGGTAGPASVTFALYREEAGGDALWSETQTVEVAAGGRYTAILGIAMALPPEVFVSGEARWLGVSVPGEVERPRVMLVSVPYAFKAGDADTVGGKPLSAFVLAGDKTGIGEDGLTYVNTALLRQGLGAGGAGTQGYLGKFTAGGTELDDSVAYQSGTRIGIKTTAPAAALHVVSSERPIDAPAAFFDVINDSLGALPAIYRTARGTPGAPKAVQADDILGGLAARGYGATGYSGGRGVVAFRAAQTWTDTAQGTFLQLGTTPINGSAWVERLRITPGGDVGIGTVTPRAKLEVYHSSTLGSGLIVETNSGSTAVYGLASGQNGTGVYGNASNGAYAYGVWGVSSSGYAGWFDGKLHVEGSAQITGTLSKGSGSFKIDHPLDPEHKYLLHSFVESPDMKNIYDGIAVLDAHGEAVVTMPDWFGALNRDFRYQLTPIGAPGPSLHIAQEVVGNQFKIAGGTPGGRVSWQVTGTRQDAFANAHRIPVEMAKPDEEQGTYLHPEAFGLPAEKGLPRGPIQTKRGKQ